MASKAKRSADTYLTDQNWENEEETPAEVGSFKPADEDVLSKRVFKKAKRRGAGGGDEEKKGGLFAGFTGFTGGTTTNTTSDKPASTFGGFSFKPPPSSGGENSATESSKSTFSFGLAAVSTQNEASKPTFSFGLATSNSQVSSTNSSAETSKPTFSFGASSTNKTENAGTSNFWTSSAPKSDFFANRGSIPPVTATVEPVKLFGKTEKLEQNDTAAEKPVLAVNPSESKTTNGSTEMGKTRKEGATVKDSDYMTRLASLNVSVSTWIQQHVAKNPCIDLTPVFKDYQRYLNDLDNATSLKESKEITPTATSVGSFKTPEAKTESADISKVAVKPPQPAIFASTPISSSNSALPSQAAKFSSSSAFSPSFFAPSNNLSVAPSKPAAMVAPATITEETTADEDAPPKVEPTEVSEPGSVHNIRSKLFYKKGNEYKDLGIGMLFVKPTEDEAKDKAIIIVRMETETANIILNILVTKNTPMARVGKNNISIVSVPNPPIFKKPEEGDNSAPLSYLLRVKGTTEADELFAKIKALCGKE